MKKLLLVLAAFGLANVAQATHNVWNQTGDTIFITQRNGSNLPVASYQSGQVSHGGNFNEPGKGITIKAEVGGNAMNIRVISPDGLWGNRLQVMAFKDGKSYAPIANYSINLSNPQNRQQGARYNTYNSSLVVRNNPSRPVEVAGQFYTAQAPHLLGG